MASPTMLDSHWVRRSFLVSGANLAGIDARNRFFSTASLKYVDTSPGANIMVNPPPQFTRFADIKALSIRGGKNRITDIGLADSARWGATMGRYYSEAIDDNGHLVHFRMGKTAFNSFLNYLTGYYSYYASYIARTGRAPGIFYTLGRAVGMVVAIKMWKFAATILAYRFLNFAMNIPKTKYAYLKPTMPVYWAAVQTLVNHIATDMGIVTPVWGGTDEKTTGKISDNGKVPEQDEVFYYFNTNAARSLHDKLPQIFDENGNVNVYAMMTKGQRLANQHRLAIKNAIDNARSSSLNADLIQIYKYNSNIRPGKTFEQYMAGWMSENSYGAYKDTTNATGFEDDNDMKKNSGGSMLEFSEAEYNDGSAFVTFRVEEGGSISESFSNSAADSELKTWMDGLASGVRSKVNTMSGGNVGDGLLSSAIETVVGSIAQIVGGTLDQVGLGGLAGLTGGGYADIPQHWESSMSSMPKGSYTIKLHSPYNNPISKLVHEIIPLCMILAMALPHSTGPQSYTGPFMLEFYDRGRAQCRYGMVDSISITRGTASTPFTQSRMWNGVEVSISILDLTSVMHMPLSEGFTHTGEKATSNIGGFAKGVFGSLFGTGDGDSALQNAGENVAEGSALTGKIGRLTDIFGDTVNSIQQIFSDETLFTDYMAILSGLGLADNIYSSRKLRLRATMALSNFKTHYSTPALAMAYGDNIPSSLIKAFYRGSEKAFY